MRKSKKCYSGIGGQAVLEGIMMKNKNAYSIAVRKPDGAIDVEIGEYKGILKNSSIMKIPFIRGVFAFIDSMILGTRCLNHSASFIEEEEPGKQSSLLMGMTTVLAVAFAIGIFMVLPYLLTSLIENYVRNASVLAIIEGAIRIMIFVLYVTGISLMKDIKRVYRYHGAEHKCINCIERGRALTVDNVMKSSKEHRRCGTSFLLFVMLISIVLFFFIRVDNMGLKILLRILLIPVISGIAYELIRLSGNYNNVFIKILSAPGMWMQGLTTKEPDEDMVEVAIKAVEAVFDWKDYQREVFGYWKDDEEKVEEEVEDEVQGSL